MNASEYFIDDPKRPRVDQNSLQKFRSGEAATTLRLGEISASLAATKRIRRLERELARKEKALAEAAALLILKKKVGHLWEGEDDDTNEGNDS